MKSRINTNTWLRLLVPIAWCKYFRPSMGDVILTACSFINRMSSSSLNKRDPFSIPFPNDPLLHVSPCVFGYVCFVHDMSPELDKLFAHVIKCFFLGYYRLRKSTDVTLLKPRSTTCMLVLQFFNRLCSKSHIN